MLPNDSVLDLTACTRADTVLKPFPHASFENTLRGETWYAADSIPPWMTKPSKKQQRKKAKPSTAELPAQRTVPPKLRTSSSFNTRQHPPSPLSKQSFSATTACPTTRPLPPLPQASPSSSTPTSAKANPLLSSSPSLPSLAATSLRKRPHSAETIIKWMDERLQQRARTPSPPSPPSPEENPTIPAPQSQPVTAPRRLTRSGSARQRVATTTARILASLPHREPPPPKPVATHRNSISSSISIPSKSRRCDPNEMPNVLSEGPLESDRMVAQHYILRTAFQGDFCAPLRSALERGAVVLDVGCGPGTWTMEMATAFPASTFLGLDIRPDYPSDIKPKNCYFRLCDMTQLPLAFPDNSIDYIFHRDLNWHLPAHTWGSLVKEYFRILRPGGWVELVEPDMETQSSGPQECAINDKLIYGLSMRRQDPYIARRLSTLLAIHGFRRIEGHFQSLPLGWGNSHATGSIPEGSCSPFATAVKSHYTFTLQSLKPWLSAVMHHMSGEKYNQHIAGLAAEWKQTEAYINWYRAVGQKPRS